MSHREGSATQQFLCSSTNTTDIPLLKVRGVRGTVETYLGAGVFFPTKLV